MGEITKGQTVPGFEKAVIGMKAEDISEEPVETRYGYHIIQLHKYVEGKDLEFDDVQPKIRDYLKQASWHKSIKQYIGILIGKSKIEGFDIEGYDSPLVQ